MSAPAQNFPYSRLKTRSSRRKKLSTRKPRRAVFVLYKTQKSITLVHAFRLAEGLNASIILVARRIKPADEAVLDEFFPRWRKVRRSTVATISALLSLVEGRHLRPIALEISKTSLPYWELRFRCAEQPAFIVGSEEDGIAEELLARVRDHVHIPMAGTTTCFSAGMALAIVASHFSYVAKEV
jgi:tRNA G18 (ribose-2'-O)-methylase SpoU